MSARVMPEAASSFDDLAGDVELDSIRFFEISAVLNEDAEEPGPSTETIEPLYRLLIGPRPDGRGFRVRIRAELEVSIGRIVVDVCARYKLTELTTVSIPRPIMLEFANRVAAMTLVPYIRTSVGDITLRVFGTALLMPLVGPGDLVFSTPPA